MIGQTEFIIYYLTNKFHLTVRAHTDKREKTAKCDKNNNECY